MKRCSTSLAMNEMKMKIILSYHYILSGMAKTKKKVVPTPHDGKDMEKLDNLFIGLWKRQWYSHSEKQFGNSYKTNHATNKHFSNCTPGHLS